MITCMWSEGLKSVLEAWCISTADGPIQVLTQSVAKWPKNLREGLLHGEVKRKQLQVGRQFSKFCCSIFAIEGKHHVLIMYTKI